MASGRMPNSTEIRRGAIGDPSAWSRLTDIVPRSLSTALSRAPASIQDRWFAGLYLLKPIIFPIFALFWIGTGLLSIGPSYDIGTELMREPPTTDVKHQNLAEVIPTSDDIANQRPQRLSSLDR